MAYWGDGRRWGEISIGHSDLNMPDPFLLGGYKLPLWCLAVAYSPFKHTHAQPGQACISEAGSGGLTDEPNELWPT